MGEQSEAKSAKRSFASKKLNLRYFGAKFRFSLLALLRSAISSKIQVDNYLVIFPARVNFLVKMREAKLNREAKLRAKFFI